MPAPRRQRRSELVALACSPTKSNDAGAGPVNSSETLAGSTEPPAVVSNHKVVSGCDSPAQQGATIDKSLSITNPSEDCSVLTAECIPSDTATPPRVGTPKLEDALEPGDLEKVESSEINYLNPPDNPFKVKADSDTPQVPKPGTLFAAIHKSRQAAASARAGSDPHVWLMTPMGKTGTPALDHALDDLRSSRYCLWMGDSHRILKNCAWVDGEQPYTATLQWKPDSSSKIVHDEGDAILGFLGTVSSIGCTAGPEGGWQSLYGERKLNKQKRNFRTPQVVEAYDRHDKLIHPNNVVATLSDAIVIVYCTLERTRFPKNIKRPQPEYQFYANLVKVQIIKNAPPPKPTAGIKRKFVRSYGATDRFGLDSSNEAAPDKKTKYTE
ncbi:hypothetical protein FRC07_007229 [Ceratobasidium sp. 392]|nr:hypothetical protein FRC07_007229 [Ceratobasidium sp. 392]